jgi:hypothetical protein
MLQLKQEEVFIFNCPRKIRDKKNSVQKLPVASFE